MPVVGETVVCRRCVYGERFRLPGPGRIVVSTGDLVTPADVVGYIVERGPVRVVDLASELGVAPRRVSQCLVIKEGQSVRAGELLARREAWPRPREVRAPENARAMALGGGMALLEGFPTEVPVRGCLPGRVGETYPGSGMEVEGRGAVIVAAALLGSEFSGPLKMVGPVPERVLRPEHVDATAHGAVLVGGIGEDPAALTRAAEFGAQGVVLGGVPGAWAETRLPLPVAVVEGFGRVPMNRLAFDLMNEIAGSVVYVLRRGSRCWLLSPQDVEPEGRFDPVAVRRLEAEAEVRLVAGPQAGSIGRVVEILAGSGEAIVQLGGKRVTALVANCELVFR
ncbi:MAG: hypothetical protein HPY83_01025 [Anaerolineae bacterium]|nr:hypothetical protein [Anaerolineae bacterium]